MPASKRPPTYYALWDVDGNLTIEKHGERYLNTELLFAHALLGVRQGVFFTNYDMVGFWDFVSKHPVEESLAIRKILKAKVEEYGFQVDAVVTNLDHFYEKNYSGPSNVKLEHLYPITEDEKKTSWKVGEYYKKVILPYEEKYLQLCASKDPNAFKANFLAERPIQNIKTQEKELEDNLKGSSNDAKAISGYSDYNSLKFGAKNSKFYMFHQLLTTFGRGSVISGIDYVKNNNIIFVFSDDRHYYREAVRLYCAQEHVGLEDHLVCINTGRKGPTYKAPEAFVKPSAATYLAQISHKIPVVHEIIERQTRMTNGINKTNQLFEMRKGNYRAAKRLAVKSGTEKKRRSRQDWRTHTSTTFRKELGENICLMWSLRFLKLAWLFRKDPYAHMEKPRKDLQHAILLKRLYEIYQTQRRLVNPKSKGLYEQGFSVITPGFTRFAQGGTSSTAVPSATLPANYQRLEADTQQSPWRPLLNLADEIDDVVLQSNDWVALFRLGLYYAVIDAARCVDMGEYHYEIIRQCFDKVSELLTKKIAELATYSNKVSKRLHGKAVKRRADFEILKTEILNREAKFTPGCHWFRRRSVVIFSSYYQPTAEAGHNALVLTPGRKTAYRGGQRPPSIAESPAGSPTRPQRQPDERDFGEEDMYESMVELPVETSHHVTSAQEYLRVGDRSSSDEEMV